MHAKNEYDIIVVGAGIAGLYSAYKIRHMAPHISILVLEGKKKKYIGGRISNDTFYGTVINNGAGIGNRNHDVILMKLLHDLKIECPDFTVTSQYAKTLHPVVDIKRIYLHLKDVYKSAPEKYKGYTMKEFTTKTIGMSLYKKFVTCSGYADYTDMDCRDFFYDYGFEHMYDSWTGVKVPWKRLVDTLCKKIGEDHIKASSKVVSIDEDKQSGWFHMETKQGQSYVCRQIILATTITSALQLIPGAKQHDSLYRQIHPRAFLRMYGKFDKTSAFLMKQLVPITTIVPGPIHKILPVDKEKGIYQIAYTDSEGAQYFHRKNRLENTEQTREFWCRMLETSLGLERDTLYLVGIQDYYWPVAEHYYEPLREPFKTRREFLSQAQHPMKNMLVVGEMVCTYPGWTEGALESVEAVLHKSWLL
jgi:hypothetical protein